jgi:acyl-CoA-dependent ceramide synthase
MLTFHGSQVAKMLRYTSFPTLCDCAFGIFLVSWGLTRQVFFGMVVWSSYKAPALMPYKWIPEQGYWFTHQVYIAFVSLLVSLLVR